MTFTKPDDDRPNSALAPSATTTTSWTASRLNVKAGRWPPRCSPKNGLLKSAPSTEMLFWMPFWPLIVSSSPSGPCTVVTPGRELREVEEVVPVVRQVLDGPVVDSRRAFDAGRFDDGSLAGDPDLLPHRGELRLEIQADRLSDRQVDSLADQGRETLCGHGDDIGAGRQPQAAEPSFAVGRDGLLVVGRRILQRDRGAAERSAVGVVDGAFDHAGDGFRLGEENGSKKHTCRQNRDESAEPFAHNPLLLNEEAVRTG